MQPQFALPTFGCSSDVLFQRWTGTGLTRVVACWAWVCSACCWPCSSHCFISSFRTPSGERSAVLSSSAAASRPVNRMLYKCTAPWILRHDRICSILLLSNDYMYVPNLSTCRHSTCNYITMYAKTDQQTVFQDCT